MIPHDQHASRSGARGFSMLEILVVLVILSLLAAASAPAVQGLIREYQAREPIAELARQAREVRTRAMRLQRPYQIGFDAQGFYAAPYYQPYGQENEYETLRLEQEAARLEQQIRDAEAQRFGTAENLDPAGEIPTVRETSDTDFLFRYEWPEDMHAQIRFWGEADWEILDGVNSRRWVFQPTGLATPLRIRLENDGAFFEVKFSPLTGEIEEEMSWVE